MTGKNELVAEPVKVDVKLHSMRIPPSLNIQLRPAGWQKGDIKRIIHGFISPEFLRSVDVACVPKLPRGSRTYQTSVELQAWQSDLVSLIAAEKSMKPSELLIGALAKSLKERSLNTSGRGKSNN